MPTLQGLVENLKNEGWLKTEKIVEATKINQNKFKEEAYPGFVFIPLI